MDYGGREEVPISTLAPLPEKFQLFPFQMLHCCFTDQSTLSFSRDVGPVSVCACMSVCMSNLEWKLSSFLFFSLFSSPPPLSALLSPFFSLLFSLICFSSSPSSFPLLSSSQAKWNFSDTTRNGYLSVTILKTLPDKPYVPLHVVKLESVTSGEPFDIGATVVAIAEASSGPQKVRKCLTSCDILLE